MPLPHKILTVGHETKRILEKYGNFPENILDDGCALRYERLLGEKIRKRKKEKKILVALPIGSNASINLINLLLNVFGKKIQFSVIIKSHPVTPIEKILSKNKINLPDHFKTVKNVDIYKLLNDADILIYNETTVAMEALMLGIPVIYADISNYYDGDRLFTCRHLKWSANTSVELEKAINDIYNMDIYEFEKQQDSSRKYMKRYFLPITDNRLKKFIK